MASTSELARDLTLAAIEKMDFRLTTNRQGEQHNEYVASEISKLYEKIYDTLIETENSRINHEPF